MEIKKLTELKTVRGFFIDGTGFIAKQDAEGNMVFPCKILISPSMQGVRPGSQVLFPIYPDKDFTLPAATVERICDSIPPELLEFYSKLYKSTNSKITLPSKADILSLKKETHLN
jgi:hypothetical protein